LSVTNYLWFFSNIYIYILFFVQVFPKSGRYIAMGSVNKNVTYGEAQQECTKVGSGLAIVRNQSDLDLVRALTTTSRIHLLTKDLRFAFVWISGRGVDGVWQWYTGEEMPKEWPLWGSNEPSTDNLIGDSCIRMKSDIRMNGFLQIRAGSCGHLSNSFLCEWWVILVRNHFCHILLNYGLFERLDLRLV